MNSNLGLRLSDFAFRCYAVKRLFFSFTLNLILKKSIYKEFVQII